MIFGDKSLDLTKPQLMAVLNVTPDSFSDGGQLLGEKGHDWDVLYRRVEHMLQAGASIIDVGGESTRPGAALVSEAEEMQRVLPAIENIPMSIEMGEWVIENIRARFDTVVSVDTSTPALITASADAGVGLINDVRALARNGAMQAAVNTGLPVCLMHMQGKPETMQKAPQYDNVADSVAAYLNQQVGRYVAAGGSKTKVILDPGFGFGKSFEHNVSLFKQLSALCTLGYPLLVGVSRKQMIGTIIDKPPRQRAVASAVAAALAVQHGASIVRVHDVQETHDAIKTLEILGD